MTRTQECEGTRWKDVAGKEGGGLGMKCFLCHVLEVFINPEVK